MIALTQLPIQRLVTSRRSWVSMGAWALFALFAAFWIKRAGADAPASDALLGIYATFALPLLTFGLVGAVAKGQSFAMAGQSLVTLGAPGPLVALAHSTVAIASSALASGLLGALIAAIGHGPGDPALGKDLFTCAWVGALGGAAYGGLFSLGSCFGPRGSGRSVLLVLNWIASSSSLGLLLPHAHVRSLLGGDPAGALSQRSSALALVAICLACTLIASWRARR